MVGSGGGSIGRGGGGGFTSIYNGGSNGEMTLSAAAAAAAAAEAQSAKYPVINDSMIEMETYANANGLSVRDPLQSSLVVFSFLVFFC